MSSDDELFGLTADLAAGFHSTLGDRSVRAEATFDELVESLGGPLPDEGQRGRGRRLGAGRNASSRASWARRRAATSASSSAARSRRRSPRTGSRAPGIRTRSRSSRSPAAAAAEHVAAEWVAELLGLPDGVSSGFVTGAQGANTTGLAAARRHVLARGGLGRLARRAPGRAADPRARRCGAPCDDRPVAAPARARHRRARARAGRRAGTDAGGRASRRAGGRGRADDRLRPGGQRQHGGGRPGRRDRRCLRDGRRVAARRRRLRALGRGKPALPPSHRRLRARRLVGDGRAQVAQRPVRLRPRLLPASRCARRGDGRRRELPPACRRPQSVRLGAGVLASCARVRRVGGGALPGPGRRCRPRRALLRARAHASRRCSGRSRTWRS